MFQCELMLQKLQLTLPWRELDKEPKDQSRNESSSPYLRGQCQRIWEQKCNTNRWSGVSGETSPVTGRLCGCLTRPMHSLARSPQKPPSGRYTGLPPCPLRLPRWLQATPQSTLVTDAGKNWKAERPGFCSGLYD